MNPLSAIVFLSVVLLVQGCSAQVEDDPATTPPPSACSAFGEAPTVTTIRIPVTAPQPHPDCIAQDELSAAGQRVYCCMGAEFDAWYAGIHPE